MLAKVASLRVSKSIEQRVSFPLASHLSEVARNVFKINVECKLAFRLSQSN